MPKLMLSPTVAHSAGMSKMKTKHQAVKRNAEPDCGQLRRNDQDVDQAMQKGVKMPSPIKSRFFKK